MNTTYPPAPTKASEAILMALEDLEAIEKTPGYRIDMGTWHRPGHTPAGEETLCYVCLAGSVLANRLGVSPDDFADPESVCDPEWARILNSLNRVRLGYAGRVDHMYERPGHPSFLLLDVVPKPASYRHDPEQFKADLRNIADLYEEKENRIAPATS